MFNKNWNSDVEYMSYVKELLNSKEIQNLKKYTQHHFQTRLDHVILVSYISYLIAKKFNLDSRSIARAGILHDLFYYDWRVTKFKSGNHAWIHPRIALRNAEKITELNKLEKDIIIHHMFGATLTPPKSIEGLIVTTVDKYVAVVEYSKHLSILANRKFSNFKEKIRSNI